MRTRAMKNKTVVWFGSYGRDPNTGKAMFYNPNDKHQSYSEKQEAVVDSLTQRLSVLQGELWYLYSYGMPIFDKINSKTFLDTHVASVVNQHPEVIKIISFASKMEANHKYSCNMSIGTIYGDIDLGL